MKLSQKDVLKKVRKPMPRPTRKEESKRVKEARKRRAEFHDGCNCSCY